MNDILMTYEKFLQRIKKRKSSDAVEDIKTDFQKRSEEYISDLIVKEFEKNVSSDFEAERFENEPTQPSYLRKGAHYPGLLKIKHNDYTITIGLNSTRAKIWSWVYDDLLDEKVDVKITESITVDSLIDKLAKVFKKLDKISTEERNSRKILKKHNV